MSFLVRLNAPRGGKWGYHFPLFGVSLYRSLRLVWQWCQRRQNRVHEFQITIAFLPAFALPARLLSFQIQHDSGCRQSLWINHDRFRPVVLECHSVRAQMHIPAVTMERKNYRRLGFRHCRWKIDQRLALNAQNKAVWVRS